MVITETRHRATTAIGVVTAALLVGLFGSPVYVQWAADNARPDTAGGLFLRTLAWPAWSLNTNASVREVLANDLKAIMVIAFAAVFLSILARVSPYATSMFNGWAAFMFAGALAGFIAAFLSNSASLFTAMIWAVAGVAYGLLIGWIVGLAELAARRP